MVKIRQNFGISVLIKTGPVAKLLSWQQHNRCRFVSYVMNISSAKFEEHCFNIPRDIQGCQNKPATRVFHQLF